MFKLIFLIFYSFNYAFSSNQSIDTVRSIKVSLPETNSLNFFDQHINKIIAFGVSIICLNMIIDILQKLKKESKNMPNDDTIFTLPIFQELIANVDQLKRAFLDMQEKIESINTIKVITKILLIKKHMRIC